MFLDFNQSIEVNELPFGKVYSRFLIQVFDEKSQLISKGTEDSVSTEIIETRISTLVNSSFLHLFIIFNC